MESKLIIYGDLVSQPVRAVISFCKFNRIPYSFKVINIAKGEHLTEDFKKVNPKGKVPAIQHFVNNEVFNLSESHAILRYLVNVYDVEEKWYPKKDFKRRALIDEYLDFHHLNTRISWSSYFFNQIINPLLPKKRNIPDTKSMAIKLLTNFNEFFEKNEFLVGNEISIADLSFVCELNQLDLTDIDTSKYVFLNKYKDKMNSYEEMKETNKILKIFSQKLGLVPKF